MFYYFLVELLTYYDITKFHDHGPQIGKLQGGGGIRPPWLYQILKSQARLGFT